MSAFYKIALLLSIRATGLQCGGHFCNSDSYCCIEGRCGNNQECGSVLLIVVPIVAVIVVLVVVAGIYICRQRSSGREREEALLTPEDADRPSESKTISENEPKAVICPPNVLSELQSKNNPETNQIKSKVYNTNPELIEEEKEGFDSNVEVEQFQEPIYQTKEEIPEMGIYEVSKNESEQKYEMISGAISSGNNVVEIKSDISKGSDLPVSQREKLISRDLPEHTAATNDVAEFSKNQTDVCIEKEVKKEEKICDPPSEINSIQIIEEQTDTNQKPERIPDSKENSALIMPIQSPILGKEELPESPIEKTDSEPSKPL